MAAGISFGFDRKRMVADANEVLALFGVQMIVDWDALVAFKPRRSFWQKLKEEIAARPRVF